MWHYPTAGQKKSEGAVFQKEREVPREAGGSERDGRFRERREVPRGAGGFRGKVFRGGASGVLRGCFKGNASKEMPQRGCSGMLWDVLGCSGKLKETKKIQSNKVKQKNI